MTLQIYRYSIKSEGEPKFLGGEDFKKFVLDEAEGAEKLNLIKLKNY